MPFIKGIDDQGKTHWLAENGYWGERLNACNFTPAKANQLAASIRARNAYLTSDDIIVPLIQDTCND
jgi:hypothetical protein